MSYLPSGQYRQDLGNLFDVVKSFGKTAVDVAQQYGSQAGQAEAYRQMALAQKTAAAPAAAPGMPSWLLPAVIGAGALVLILVLKKK